MTKKHIGIASLILTVLISLSGCSEVGSKSANMSAIYTTTTILSFLLLLGYSFLIKKKEPWFLVLFSAVTVVNIGYLTLSLSTTLDSALLSNRIAYLGSVFLPVSMLMSILKTCRIKLKKWMVSCILGISLVVFLIAASPGFLDIYYKEVSLVNINGVSVLEKVYGPLHSVYLYYLLLHFASMIGVIIYSRVSKRIKSSVHAVVLLGSVIVNIGVWLMEQLVDIDFEILSVSYIASELFLLGVSLLVQEHSILNSLIIATPTPPKAKENVVSESINTRINPPKADNTEEIGELHRYLTSKLYTLTPTEKEIFRLYLEGSKTKDVMAALNITENTVKYHNKNIYSKLGVSSRKQLLEAAKYVPSEKVSL